MNRRRMMMLLSNENIPKGYKRLKFLESDGSQYIDTKYNPVANTRWELDAQFTKIIDRGQFNGRYFGTGGIYSRFDIAISSQGNFQLNINTAYNITTADTNRHLFFVDSKNLKVGYDNISQSATERLNSANRTISLFARHEETSFNYMCNMRLFSCSFYEDDELVCKLLPCLDDKGVPCLYDVVRKITLYNATKTDFLYERL